MILFNIWGSPGSGKTTTAAELFVLLKKCHYNVELVGEEARTNIYNGSTCQLDDNQFVISGKQYERVYCLLRSGVQIAISDSPIQQGSLYSQNLPYHKELQTLLQAAQDVFRLNGNGTYDIFVNRAHPYRAGERRQTAEQAAAFGPQIREILGRPFNMEICGNETGNNILLEWVVRDVLPSWGDKGFLTQ